MENYNFHVGQIVVSLVTSTNTATLVEKDKEYEVLSIRKGCSHAPILLDIGGHNNKSYCKCGICDTRFDGIWAPAKWFRPKDQLPSEEKKEDNQFKEVTFTKIREMVPMQSEN